MKRVFGMLSSIPYLKRVMMSVWILSTVFLFLTLILRLVFDHEESKLEVMRSISFFTGGNLIWFYFFKRWHIYDRENQQKEG
jgi:hypothetical protein